MTGLFGIAQAASPSGVGRELEQMVSCAPREPWYGDSGTIDERGRFGLRVLSHESPALESIGAPSDGSLWVLGRPAGSDEAANLGWGRGGFASDRLANQPGAFLVVHFDRTTGVVSIANDRFGLRPLYYVIRDGQLRFATHLRSLTLDDEDVRVSPSGVAQFFTFGQFLGNGTLLEDIQVLPAGSILTFDPKLGAASIHPYAKQAPAEFSFSRPQEWVEAITDATQSAVRRASRGVEGLGVALSGGLDSRTILGLLDLEQTPAQTFCLGMPHSLDVRCAQEMARRLGCPFTTFALDGDFLGQFEQHLLRMIDLTGGQYLSQCIVMPTLPLYRELGIRVLLRGHAGELMHMAKAYAYSVDREAMEIRTREEAREWLFRRTQAYMLDGVEGPLFRGEYAQAMQDGARAAFDHSFDAIPETADPRQAIWHAFLRERIRRETSLSLSKFHSVCDVRVPLLDGELVDLLLAAPIDLKTDATLQCAILKRHRPELLSVVNANTGAPMTAGLLRSRWSTLRMRAFAKLGVPGYQPYERLGLWLRRELDELVRRVLLDERCLGRGVFDPDGVRRVVDRHGSRKANHTYLLLAMLIFEAGQRRGADRSQGVRASELVASP